MAETLASLKLGTSPVYRSVNLLDQHDKLIAPVEFLFLKQSIFLIVHPSAAEQVKEKLQTILPEGSEVSTKQRFLNTFRVYSKQASLQHLYNVLEPLSADSATKQIFAAIEQSDFDANTLQSGQALVLNLTKINTDFRINERVFRD